MHAGYLSTSCGTCHKQEKDVRDSLGCNPEVAANQPAWILEEDEKSILYYNCPSMFIPEWVWNFWDVYKGYQKGRYRVPAYDEQPRKYIQACDIYEAAYGLFQMLKMRDDQMKAQMNKFGKARF